VSISNRLRYIIWCSQTSAVRFWFGLTSIGFGSFFMFSATVHHPLSEYNLMLKLASDWVWALCFVLNGFSLLYGIVFATYNRLLVVLEGLLGTVVWVASASAVVITQQSIGAHVVGGLIAFWILIRYPTHKEFKDAV
jgi:hypothetical protein